MSALIVCNNSYSNDDVLENLVSYALEINKDKLNVSKQEVMWCGFGVNTYTPQYAINSMNTIKRLYNNEAGRQAEHFIISIYQHRNYGVSHRINIAQNLMYEAGNFLVNMGYQSICGIHNNEGNVHIHFIVNSVNYMDGKKIHNTKVIYNALHAHLKNQNVNLNWEGVFYK